MPGQDNLAVCSLAKRFRTNVFSIITNFSCINNSNRELRESSVDVIHTPDSSSKQMKVPYHMDIQYIHKLLLDEKNKTKKDKEIPL